jgi:dolichyl-phosphate-mannose-protein mannosyltransferase
VKFNRSVWIFLVLGIALRCVALNQPLVDAHLIRQCQTAAATKSLIAEPGFHLNSKIPWLGDLDAHYILELPLYNYLVMGVHALVRNLDISGKLTTIFLWAASFICLQLIWRRILDQTQTFWANLLFLVAPLSVFYGQAFMPEMLVQLLAFGFIWQVLRYNENPNLGNWICLAGIGLLGLLIKLPETAHLYLILGFLIFQREGWKATIRPRYLLAAIVTVVVLKTWSTYLDSVNKVYAPQWTSMENLRLFIGSLGSRFQVRPWLMISLYLSAFVVPGIAALATVYGLWISFRKWRWTVLSVWLGSLVIFYLLWFGNGPPAQSYYNLPALAPMCALFGIGMHDLLMRNWIRRWPPALVTSVMILALVIPAVPVWKYLFKQDRQILAAALWARENTAPDDVIVFCLNHRFDMIDYPFNAVPSYYSERPTFIWSRYNSDVLAATSLAHSRYGIVTRSGPVTEGPLAVINRFRGRSTSEPESLEWLNHAGFHPVAEEPGFRVFKKE